MTQPTVMTINRHDEAGGQISGKPRILMFTHRFPFPLDRGDRIRAYHILKYLSCRAHVTLASTNDRLPTRTERQEIEKLTAAMAIESISPWASRARGLAALLRGQAITPAYFYRPRLANTIRRWHEQQPFDAVFTFCTSMIQYARVLTQQEAINKAGRGLTEICGRRLRHVIDLVDVDSCKWQAYAEHARGIKRMVYLTESRRLRDIEAGCFDAFDGIAVVSKAEAELYRRHVTDHTALTVVRHAVDTDSFAPAPDVNSKTLLFVGVLNYKPNVDGVSWFVDEVMPLLSKRVKGVQLKIVGRNATAAVRALSQKRGVEVVGSVPDVRPYLRQASVVIAPLRIGRGVQTKVLEAMASARAVVCSPEAANGIEAEQGRHLLVANSPEQWVDKIAQVIANPVLRTKLAVMGRARVENRYQWEQCLQPLNKLLSLSDPREEADPLADRTDSWQNVRKAA